MNIKRILSLLCVSLFLVMSANAAVASDVKLTVGTGTATATSPATVNITADPISGGTPTIAGAAFTIQYDSSLSVTVDNSNFFGTFVAQGYTAGQDGLDASGFVDGTYDTPFVTNETTESGMKITRIAAARKDSATITAGTVLFTLSVTGTTSGTYPIKIIPTTLTNTAAGWDNEASELLIDVDGDNYPVRLSKSDTANMVAGSVTVPGGTMTDNDSDGIDDNWEEQYFGDLTTADTTTDFDQDGYKDVDEYNNSIGGTDANGNVYDPNFMNAPGGTGYTAPAYELGDVNMDGEITIEDVKRAFELFGGAAPVSDQEYRLANPCPSEDSIQPSIIDVKALFVIFGGGDPYAGTCQ